MKSLIIDGKVRELTDEEAKKIEEILTPKRVELEHNKLAFRLLSYGVGEGYGYSSTSTIDAKSLLRGTLFATKEEAEREDQKRLALGRIRKYVVENDVKMAGFGWEPDWSDDSMKYQIVGWDYGDDDLRCDYWQHRDVSPFGFIFPITGDRQRVIDNCAKDLEILLKK